MLVTLFAVCYMLHAALLQRSLLYALVDRWQEAEDWEPIMAADDPFHSHCECRPLVCVCACASALRPRPLLDRVRPAYPRCRAGLLLHHGAVLLQMGGAGAAKVGPAHLSGRWTAVLRLAMPAASLQLAEFRQRLRYDIALTMLVWLALGGIKLWSYWQWLFAGEAVPIGDCFKFALAAVCQVQLAMAMAFEDAMMQAVIHVIRIHVSHYMLVLARDLDRILKHYQVRRCFAGSNAIVKTAT